MCVNRISCNLKRGKAKACDNEKKTNILNGAHFCCFISCTTVGVTSYFTQLFNHLLVRKRYSQETLTAYSQSSPPGKPHCILSWSVVSGGYVRGALRETVNQEGSLKTLCQYDEFFSHSVLRPQRPFPCCSVSQQVQRHFRFRDACKAFPIPQTVPYVLSLKQIWSTASRYVSKREI